MASQHGTRTRIALYTTEHHSRSQRARKDRKDHQVGACAHHDRACPKPWKQNAQPDVISTSFTRASMHTAERNLSMTIALGDSYSSGLVDRIVSRAL